MKVFLIKVAFALFLGLCVISGNFAFAQNEVPYKMNYYCSFYSLSQNLYLYLLSRNLILGKIRFYRQCLTSKYIDRPFNLGKIRMPQL